VNLDVSDHGHGDRLSRSPSASSWSGPWKAVRTFKGERFTRFDTTRLV
jgi:hypothetical protein